MHIIMSERDKQIEKERKGVVEPLKVYELIAIG